MKVTLCGTLGEIIESLEKLNTLVDPQDTILIRENGDVLIVTKA